MAGVYLSFPFCAQKCTYCNFASGVFPRELEERYLNALEEEIRRHERTVEQAGDADSKRLSQKNLAILEKRRERLAEIKRFVVNAQGQMDLIENTFELLGDQIVTMRSPTQLGGQLDELIDGVEAVRSTAREAASFMESVSQ